ERVRRRIVLLRYRAFDGAHGVALLALEFSRRETEPFDSQGFSEQGFKATLETVLLYACAERRHFQRTHEFPAARACAQERRIRLLRHFRKACGEQAAE